MTTVAVAQLLAIGLTLFALVAAAFVLGREATRRVRTRVMTRQLDVVRRALTESGAGSTAELVAKLRKDFDRVVVERAVELFLKTDDDSHNPLGAELFRELGLIARHVALLREARAWGERTNSAQVLGRAGCAEGIPALVLAMRDPHEDATVKTAAAEALAKFRDVHAVPFLVRELQELDEGASRPIAEALVRFGEVAVPDLLGLLADESHPSGRVWAARILGQVGATDAVEPLIVILHARNDLLRVAAAAALGELHDRRALQPLVQAALRDPAPQVRAHAAGAVALIEAEGAVDVLVAALADPDYVTRLRALEAFENIQLKDTTPLVHALRDSKNEVRRRAALALERVGYLDRVVEEMASSDARVSRDAYFRLLELGRAGLADGVVSFINHASFQVRALAARAAGDLGATDSARLVFAAANDTSWPVRASVAETIGRLRLDGGEAHLVERLADTEEPVREAAAEAIEAFPASKLGPYTKEISAAYARGSVPVRLHMVTVAARMADDAAVDLLIRASTDPSEAVRVQAVRAMGAQEEGEKFLAPLVERITDASLEVRTAAVAALGKDASSDAFEALVRSLPGAPARLRERIAEALARGGRGHLFQRMDELSKVDDADVRLGLAWTLGRVGEPAVVPYLVRLLQAPEPAVRASAAGALAKVADPAVVDALLDACEDRDPRTRAAVVNALGKQGIGDARVAANVRARLKDPDAFVRNRAALVLAIVAGPDAEASLTDSSIEVLVAAPARLVALAVTGSESALARALDLMTEAGALQAAVAFLGHEDAHLRATFFERLRLPDPKAVPHSLQDPALVPHYGAVLRSSLDIDSRRVAVEALARVPSALAVEVLADALQSDPAEAIRLRTATALAPRTNDERARAALIRAMQDPSAEVATVAIRALRQTRDPRAQNAVFQRLGASSSVVREAVEESLAEMHRGDVMPLVDRIMGVSRPEILVAGVRVLERILDPATVPLLEFVLKSRQEEVRAAALRALSRMPANVRNEAAIDATLDDPSEQVRSAAILAIASSADANAVRRLERLRLDPSAALRIELARRLASTPAEPSLALLKGLADDGAVAVRAAAFASLLERAEAPGLALFLERWRKAVVDLRAEPRAEAITARLVLILTASSDEDARKAAVAGIASLRAAGFEKYVVPALRDPSAEVRLDAIRALTGSDDPEVRSHIAELLDDPNAAVREAARRAPLRLIG